MQKKQRQTPFTWFIQSCLWGFFKIGVDFFVYKKPTIKQTYQDRKTLPENLSLDILFHRHLLAYNSETV